MARVPTPATTCHLVSAAICLFIVIFAPSIEARTLSRRAIMMKLTAEPSNCSEDTIVDKVANNSVILTGTIVSCDGYRAGSYSCRIKVWRILKGEELLEGIITGEDTFSQTFQSNSFVNVYGFGNKEFCRTVVTAGDTKIFFMNPTMKKLILGNSVMHITLKNLEHTQAVIEGKEVEEMPTTSPDPCLDILCGYGARCKVMHGLPTCMCPEVSCEDEEEVGESSSSPICGSNGVTYSSECHLRAAQCKKQKRIKIISNTYCSFSTYPTYSTSTEAVQATTERPSTGGKDAKSDELCKDVECSFGAKCVVKKKKHGKKMETKCVCETCDDVPVAPVCGSDQKSHRTKCEMERLGCLESKEITVLRQGPCDPCEIYNATLKAFVRSCTGICTIDKQGSPRCCDDIICDNDRKEAVCGSDGRTYESACSLKKYACRTARDISIVAKRECGAQKPNTFARGSFSIATNENCPANCDIESEEFDEYTKVLEHKINRKLGKRNKRETDKMSGFEIEQKRENSIVFFFTVTISTSNKSHAENELPDDRYLWAYKRLFDPNNGVVIETASAEKLDLVHTRNSAYNFFVEDVCLTEQCANGQRCTVKKSSDGQLTPMCSCDAIADPDRLPYTHACEKADNSHVKYKIFSNKEDVRKKMCQEEPRQFYFVNICEDQEPIAVCGDDCNGDGETCVLTNGQPKCVCITCNQNEYLPVCASNGDTFRSKCMMQQYNCEHNSNLHVTHAGSCENTCEGMECPFNGECTISDQGLRTCVCPTKECPTDDEMVCGSDDMEYENECELNKYACENQIELSVQQVGGCDMGSGSGSGAGSDCDDCEFGICKPLDDQYECSCDFECEDKKTKQVCGSDGKTYRNKCELKQEQCEKGQSINVASKGACKAEMDCVCHHLGTASSDLKGSCDPVTSQCPCRPFVGGQKCDRCLPGYWNLYSIDSNSDFDLGCQKCKCNPFGSIRADCEQNNGTCSCKPGVYGLKCDKCKDDGSEVTSTVCQKVVNPSSDLCNGEVCPPGKQCKVTGDFDLTKKCVCKPLSDCEDVEENTVCASNGITYPSPCVMYAENCPYDDEVHVVKEGPCDKGEKDGDSNEPYEESGDGSGDDADDDDGEDDNDDGDNLNGSDGSGDQDPNFEPEFDIPPPGKIVLQEVLEPEPEMLEPEVLEPESKPEPEFMMKGEAKFPRLKYDRKLLSPSSALTEEYRNKISKTIFRFARKSPALQGKLLDVLVDEYLPTSTKMKGITVNFGLVFKKDESSTPLSSELVQASLNRQARDSKEAQDFQVWLAGGEVHTPQFGGSSFIRFDPITEFSELFFSMVFKSYDQEGLLIYIEVAQYFIAVIVDEGNVVFKYDGGKGELMLRSNVDVADGNWHTFSLLLNRRDGMLQVDQESKIRDSAPEGSNGIQVLTDSIFVGGVDESLHKTAWERSGVRKGLTGCVANLYSVIGNMNISTAFRSARKTHRISECGLSPCLPNPCLNKGNCLVNDEENFSCLCYPCSEGELCEKTTLHPNPCLSNPCSENRVCKALDENQDFECVCLTEEGLETNCSSHPVIQKFTGTSYVIIEDSDVVYSDAWSISIVFMAEKPNGLLYYISDAIPTGNKSAALLLKESDLVLVVSYGIIEDIFRIKSNVSLNSWHNVRITSNEDYYLANFDDHTVVNHRKKINFDIIYPVVIGGAAPGYEATIANISQGIEGYIQHFSMNGESLMVRKDKKFSTNIRELHETNSCDHSSACSRGICIPQTQNEDFQCRCEDGFTGSDCSKSMDDQAVHFNGTYSIYQLEELTDRNPREHDVVTVVYRNSKPNGTLLEIELSLDGAQGPSERSFVSLEVFESNTIKAVMNLPNDEPLEFELNGNDPGWNTVKLEMWKDLSLLYVNDGGPAVLYHYNPERSSLRFGKTVSIGGSAENSSSNFDGCIGEVKLGSHFVDLSSLQSADGKEKLSACKSIKV